MLDTYNVKLWPLEIAVTQFELSSVESQKLYFFGALKSKWAQFALKK